MTDRAHVIESVQMGDETTPGTAVPADKTIRSMSIDTKIGGQADPFRPDGRKFNALFSSNMEWSTFGISGPKAVYGELMYPLIALFGAPSPSTVGTLGRTRVFTMSDTAMATVKTFTIEKGSAARAQKLAYALLTDLGLTFSRKNGVGVTGQGIGQLFTDGITMTASPTDIPLVPIVGKHLNVYVDASGAALGTTKLLRAFSVEPSISGAYGPLWPIDSANASFGAHVDLAPTTGVKVVLEADAAGMAYLSQFRTDDLLFLRVQATGPEYESGHAYDLTTDYALGIKTVTPDEDDDGVTIVTYDTELVRDSTWGKALNISLTNIQASV